jgi:ADP-ribosylglycohydrolase
MLGAIIGDIVGSRWEFNPTNDYNFEWLSEENGFTDDTICTVAVADAILRDRDFGESIHEWCHRYPHPMGGYGGRFAQWVHSDNPVPYGSYGNGAAMRVSPVAHWYNTLEEVLDAAAATALPSHNHGEGIKGAQTVALAIFKALSYHGYQNAPKHIDEILDECVKFSGYDINMPKATVLNKFDETSQGTVPVALKVISMARNYEDAVRMAVGLGADADTLGAIVGSIAEAIWGIPLNIRHQIEDYLPKDMFQVLSQFYQARSRSFQPLIDTCFAGDDFSDVSWGMLYDIDGKEVYDEIKNQVKNDHEQMRKLMAERAKARENW